MPILKIAEQAREEIKGFRSVRDKRHYTENQSDSNRQPADYQSLSDISTAAGRWTRAGVRGWARPRRAMRSTYMDHASHTILAMCGAEVRIIAAAIKSVLIDRSAIGKNSSVAVRIIR